MATLAEFGVADGGNGTLGSFGRDGDGTLGSFGVTVVPNDVGSATIVSITLGRAAVSAGAPGATITSSTP